MNKNALRIFLWLITLLLCSIGLATIAGTAGSRSMSVAVKHMFLYKQAAAMGIGLVAALALSWIGPKYLRQPWLIAIGASVIIGMLVYVLAWGPVRNGARRWIDLGPIHIQPAEFAKLCLILACAWYLTRVQEKIRVHWHGVLVPMAGFALLALLVYATRDLGSVVVMGGVFWVMSVFAETRWMYLTVIALGSLPMVLYEAVFQMSYRRERFMAFLDPWGGSGGAYYHLQQSFISIGSGGMHGVGLGQGARVNPFLPEHHTDFIYAIICQEWGFIGGVAVAVLYFLLVVIGLQAANQAGDRHSRLIAIGATMLIGLQAFWNMLVVIGLVPTKGLTLPFISYGGSSAVVCMLAIGLIDAVLQRSESLSTHGQHSGSKPSRIGAQIARRPRAQAQQQLLMKSEESHGR